MPSRRIFRISGVNSGSLRSLSRRSTSSAKVSLTVSSLPLANVLKSEDKSSRLCLSRGMGIVLLALSNGIPTVRIAIPQAFNKINNKVMIATFKPVDTPLPTARRAPEVNVLTTVAWVLSISFENSSLKTTPMKRFQVPVVAAPLVTTAVGKSAWIVFELRIISDFET